MNNYQDLRQTNNYSQYMQDLGWRVDEYKGVHIYFKKILFWRFVKIQRPQVEIVKLLNCYIVKKYRYSTVYVEPGSNKQHNDLLKLGFKKYNSPFLPSKTVQIDLRRSEEQLLKEMHYKTRYNCKKATSDKMQATRSDSIDKFAEFWQRCAGQRGMFLSQKKEIRAIYNAFSKDAVIHYVHINNEWLSAILRISTSNVSYYMYAASTKDGKKLFAPTIITWEAIKAAKKEGNKVFDFEGVFDERFPLTSWKGFTRFKKGFGGIEVEYPGTLREIIL